MLSADLMIIPFKPSQPDLDTLPKIIEVIDQAKDYNPKLVVKALLTMCPTHYNIKEKEEAYQCLKEYPEIGKMNSFICDRKIYRDTISNGLGVIDSNNQKAQNEISKLVEEILNA